MQLLPVVSLLLIFSAGITNCEDEDVAALFDSLTEKSGVLNLGEDDDSPLPTEEPLEDPTAEPTSEPTSDPGADPDGDTTVDPKEVTDLIVKSDAMVALDKLKKLGLTPYKLFSIRGRSDIDLRAKLPVFGEWLASTIETEFEERNPERAYQLLTKVSDLLEIAYAGCYNHDCVIPVTTIQSDYQTLMFKAVRVSYDGIRKTVDIMKFMKAAVRESTKGRKGRGNAKKILRASLPWVNQLSKGYETLEEQTEALINKADAAVRTAGKDKLALISKWDEWEEEIKATEKQLAGQRANDAKLKIMVDQQLARLKNIEKMRNDLAVEFVRLARTNVRTHEKCDSKVLQNWATVTDHIHRTVTYNKGKGPLWGLFGGGGTGVKTFVDKKNKNVRLKDTISRRCWTQKDAAHLQELEKKMELINQRINVTRPGYITAMKQLHESQRNRASLAGTIAMAVVHVGQFNAAKDDHKNAIDGLASAGASLKLVNRIFKEAKEFWQYQKEFIVKYLKAPIGDTKPGEGVAINAGAQIALIIGTKDNKIWRDIMIETGMYWLVFGRLSSIGYVQMREAKKSINRVYVTQMDSASKKRILGKAKEVLKEIHEFAGDLHVSETVKKAKMDQVLGQILRTFGEEPDFKKLAPNVNPTGQVS